MRSYPRQNQKMSLARKVVHGKQVTKFGINSPYFLIGILHVNIIFNVVQYFRNIALDETAEKQESCHEASSNFLECQVPVCLQSGRTVLKMGSIVPLGPWNSWEGSKTTIFIWTGHRQNVRVRSDQLRPTVCLARMEKLTLLAQFCVQNLN